jgi:Flp pilus assembly protein TadG
VLRLLRSTCIPSFSLARRRRDFLRDEDGAITAMALILFLVMILAVGVSIDMARSEADRIAVQSTIDRAVLAAAPLDEEREAQEVVEDYMRAAGLDPNTVRVQAYDEERATRVTVMAESNIDSLFMRVFGTDEMSRMAASQAREEKHDMEVSLVLDLSGSMNSNNRLQDMRREAADFVDSLLDNAEDQGVLTTVSIIPYRDAVNLGSDVGSWFSWTMEHTYSKCAVFPQATAYDTIGIEAGTVLQRVAHLDRFSGRNNSGAVDDPVCPTDDSWAILPWARDKAVTRSYIEGLQARAGTAINLGAKWGLALLDPTLRPHATAMVDAGRLPAEYRGMPFNHDEENVTKVLVLMTDGMNDEQRDAFADRKSGPSGIFVYRPDLSVPVKTVSARSDLNGDGVIDALDMPCTNGNGSADGVICQTDSFGAVTGMPSYGIDNIDGTRSRWSTSWAENRRHLQDWSANGGKYTGYPWWEDLDRLNWTDFVGTGRDPVTNANVETVYSIWSEKEEMFWVKTYDNDGKSRGTWQTTPGGGTDAIELTFAEFYATVPIKDDGFWEAQRGDRRFRAKDRGTKDWFQEYAGDRTMKDELNGYLHRVCTAARAQGVMIYTIAFQTNDDAAAEMQKCSGVEYPGRHFDVRTRDIGSAFDSILLGIEKLRLTQ